MKLIKRIISVTTAVLLGIMFTSCFKDSESGSAGSKDGKLKVRISRWDFNVWGNLLVYAEKWGITDKVLKDTNIELEFIPFENGPAANEAITAGQLDFELGIGDQPFLTGNENGVDTAILAGVSREEKSQIIVTDAKSKINSPAELKGKKIGLAIGTYTHKSLIGIFKDNGISVSDVELINIKTAGDAVTALTNGDIDAYLGSIFNLNPSIEEGTIKKIGDETGHPSNSYLVATNSFIEEHPEETQKIVELVYESAKYLNEHFEEEYEYIAGPANIDPKQLHELLPLVDIDIDLRNDDIEQIKSTQDFLIEQDILSEKIENLEKDHINDTFIKKVRGGN